MLTIRGERVNFSKRFYFNDVFQCEFLAFYLAEMFKDTLCRKITYNSTTFLHSYILCKIVVNDLLNNKTYLKTYLKRKKDKDKNYEEEKSLKFFESLNDTTDFLL